MASIPGSDFEKFALNWRGMVLPHHVPMKYLSPGRKRRRPGFFIAALAIRGPGDTAIAENAARLTLLSVSALIIHSVAW